MPSPSCRPCGLALALSLALAAAQRGGATEVKHAGLKLDLPGTWLRAPGDGAVAALDEAGGRARVAIADAGEGIAVSPVHAGGLDRELRRQLRALGGFETAAIRGVSVTVLDDVPAYRVRLSLAGGTDTVEQLLYVIGSRSALVVVFSAAPNDFAALSSGFDRAVARATVERGALFGVSRSAASGFLAFWSVAGYVARRLARRRGGPPRPVRDLLRRANAPAAVKATHARARARRVAARTPQIARSLVRRRAPCNCP